jgi:hypothetical protein
VTFTRIDTLFLGGGLVPRVFVTLAITDRRWLPSRAQVECVDVVVAVCVCVCGVSLSREREKGRQFNTVSNDVNVVERSTLDPRCCDLSQLSCSQKLEQSGSEKDRTQTSSAGPSV